MLSYEQRLKSLGLPTLIYKRERLDMVQLFKILNGYDHVDMQSIHIISESVTRGHKYKLQKRHYKYKTYMKNFTARSINSWNSLPEKCVNSQSVNTFKSELNSAWKHKSNKFYYNF